MTIVQLGDFSDCDTPPTVIYAQHELLAACLELEIIRWIVYVKTYHSVGVSEKQKDTVHHFIKMVGWYSYCHAESIIGQLIE